MLLLRPWTRCCHKYRHLRPYRSRADGPILLSHDASSKPGNFSGMPVGHAVERRTSRAFLRFFRHLLSFLSRLVKCSRHAHTVRKSARFRVRCSFNLSPPHYRMTFAFSAFLYPFSHWHTLRLPTANGRDRAYRVSHR